MPCSNGVTNLANSAIFLFVFRTYMLSLNGVTNLASSAIFFLLLLSFVLKSLNDTSNPADLAIFVTLS